MAAIRSATGYWLVARDGGVFAFGDAGFYGSMGGCTSMPPSWAWPPPLMARVTGWWPPMVACSPSATPASTARPGPSASTSPIVGMAATPDGNGYWLVAADGGVFSFGDAAYYGSAGARHLKHPVVGMAASPDGKGYWLTAANGNVFSYGDVSNEGELIGGGTADVVGIVR